MADYLGSLAGLNKRRRLPQIPAGTSDWLRPIADMCGPCDNRCVNAREDDITRVFLLPCIFGDEPPFAAFRAALAGHVDFELLDYPDLDRPSSEIRDFDRILTGTLEHIRSAQPAGDVHIAGYSFGGLVGFAAACRLQAEGRRVGLLALLDTHALGLKVPNSGRLTRNRDAAPGVWGAAADVASRLLIAAGLADAVRAAVAPAGRVFGAKAASGLRRLLLQNLRGRSLAGLTLGRFDGPVILFRAEEQPAPTLPADLGWSAFCSSVRSAPLKGNHNSLFGPDHLTVNAERIWSEFDASINQPASGLAPRPRGPRSERAIPPANGGTASGAAGP
jgi:thioesterase domain-containing protein